MRIESLSPSQFDAALGYGHDDVVVVSKRLR
jgi:hypothetical protein